MSHPPEAIQKLREQGVRITPQREAVLCVLHSARGHVTAEAVFEAVQHLLPDIGLATVYRNLEFLTARGVVAVTDLGDGHMEWELLTDSPHHHAVCRQCGGVTELDHEFVRDLQERLREEHNFRADLSHMAFFGLCFACHAQAAT